MSPTGKPTERTRDKVQREAGVSEHKARQALRVVEANPELAKQVVAGEVSLKDAAKRVDPKQAAASRGGPGKRATATRRSTRPQTAADRLRPLSDAITALRDQRDALDPQDALVALTYWHAAVPHLMERLRAADAEPMRVRLAGLFAADAEKGSAALRLVPTTDPSAEAQLDAAVATLPTKQRARFEALVEVEVQRRVQKELRNRHPELVAELAAERDAYMQKHLAAATMKASMTAILTEDDYRFLLNVLHPDRAPEDRRDKFARAFDAVRKLDPYIQAVKS